LKKIKSEPLTAKMLLRYHVLDQMTAIALREFEESDIPIASGWFVKEDEQALWIGQAHYFGTSYDEGLFREHFKVSANGLFQTSEERLRSEKNLLITVCQKEDMKR